MTTQSQDTWATLSFDFYFLHLILFDNHLFKYNDPVTCEEECTQLITYLGIDNTVANFMDGIHDLVSIIYYFYSLSFLGYLGTQFF